MKRDKRTVEWRVRREKVDPFCTRIKRNNNKSGREGNKNRSHTIKDKELSLGRPFKVL